MAYPWTPHFRFFCRRANHKTYLFKSADLRNRFAWSSVFFADLKIFRFDCFRLQKMRSSRTTMAICSIQNKTRLREPRSCFFFQGVYAPLITKSFFLLYLLIFLWLFQALHKNNSCWYSMCGLRLQACFLLFCLFLLQRCFPMRRAFRRVLCR